MANKMIDGWYMCDGGGLMIGNANCAVKIPNGYGDGEFRVYVVESGYEIPKSAEFLTTIKGKQICVFSYDCLDYDEMEDDENVLFTLNGRFGVFHDNGDVYLERWGD